eukprot:7584423-Heterocapsa_arctica.AAC.1
MLCTYSGTRCCPSSDAFASATRSSDAVGGVSMTAAINHVSPYRELTADNLREFRLRVTKRTYS